MNNYEDCVGKTYDQLKELHPEYIFAPCVVNGKSAMVVRDPEQNRKILAFDSNTQTVTGIIE